MKPKSILGFAALLTLPCIFLAAQLFTHMTPELQDLLPLDSKYLKDTEAASKRIWSRDSLVLWIESDSAELSKKFQDLVTQDLKQKNISLIHEVTSTVGPEAQFFFERAGLFFSNEEIRQLEEKIKANAAKKAAAQNDKKNPFRTLIANVKELLISQKWVSRFSGMLSRYTRFKDGHYGSADGKVRLVILRVRDEQGSFNLKTALSTQNQVNSVVNQSLRSSPEFSKVNVRYTGNLRHLIEDQESIFKDIEVSTLIVLILVMLSLWFYFRSWRDLTYLLSSLTFGVLLSLGIVFFIFKPMNANAAFMTSIVIGNGINFGIILLSRIRETGNLSLSLKETRAPTLLAMAGGMASYGSLALTDFRGFQQFGIMGAVGMICCWISAMVLIPAFLRVFESAPLRVWTHAHPRLNLSSEKRLKIVSCVILLVAVASTATVALSPKFTLQFETELQNLRDQKSIQSGSLGLSYKVDQILGEQLSPLVILTSSREQAKLVSQKLLDQKNSEVRKAQIINVVSLDQLVPDGQVEKLETLKQFTKKVSKIKPELLSPIESGLIQLFSKTATTKPFTEKDLPENLLQLFDEKNGERGRIVLVESQSLRDKQNLNEIRTVVHTIQNEVKAIDPHFILMGTPSLVLELTEAVQGEAQKITLWVLIAIFLLVIVLYPYLRSSIWILSSWMAALFSYGAILLLTHSKIHMINFLAIPITVGIGIDYAANLYSRLKTERFLTAIRAVALCSLTTCLGYAALLTAGNLGLRSFAKLALLGEACCLVFAAIWGLLFLNNPTDRSK